MIGSNNEHTVGVHPAIGAYFGLMKQILDSLVYAEIDAVIETLHKARLARQTVYIMGNGGSASTASHFLCDLAKNTQHDDLPHFRVVGMTDNMAIFSAFANDEGYDQVFARQLEPLIRPNDVVIGISTSGNSGNVLNAIALANQVGANTVGFTGFDGGRLRHMTDLNVHVPSNSIEHVEDIHLMLEHLICLALRQMP
jgi:D-sedoheptulose 7-phosphate isomerase